ncbi:MAG: hypothetical protein V5A88_08820 [Candidatus Thermoplasmatota archaeon]
MIEKFIERENQIFNKLTELEEKEIDFILIGGYAVSAFHHRFSVDADIVIRKKELERCLKIMSDNGFKEIQREDLNSIYGGQFIALRKDKELPVNFDIMVDSLKCRQTEATWSYDYLHQNLISKEIEGNEKSVHTTIPEKELLIAIKLHSGRLTDVRDIVALNNDVNRDKILNHTDRGRKKDFLKILKNVEGTLDREGFEDSFKGVFSEKQLPNKNIKDLRKLISDLKTLIHDSS